MRGVRATRSLVASHPIAPADAGIGPLTSTPPGRESRTRAGGLLAAFLLSLLATSTHAGEPKALIEFGWDEPDTAFLRKNIIEMEKTPFDGCVFHVNAAVPQGQPNSLTWRAWSRRAFTEAELKPALDDLKATPFRRFTRNFLRFNTTPADLDWFDDHSAILTNARLAATLAREGRCRGILFDIEQYEGKLFDYATQRDAKTRPFEAYAAQARNRGREVMEAFQQGDPDLTILLTFGHSLTIYESKKAKKPPADSPYGLLAPFLDGMVDAAKGQARIVDGYELSYSYKRSEQFAEALTLMKDGVRPVVADPMKYAKVVTPGFGLWMDYKWPEHGWDVADPSKNYFTPEAFETSVREALKQSDEYVWIYTETPRWWSPEGGPVKLPPAYDAALRRARKGLTAD